MRYCLTCRRFLPRDAVFCPGCGGAIGGTRCNNGHTTPSVIQASFCPTCRSRSLIEPARTLELGCLSRLIGWGTALLALKWALANIGVIVGIIWNGIVFIVGCALISWVIGLVKLLLALRILIWFISIGAPEFAKSIDPFPKLLPWLVRGVGRGAWWVLRGLVYAVEGKVLPLPYRRKKDQREE